eukprot:364939-Chlamydomonas_euryale.AAC.6
MEHWAVVRKPHRHPFYMTANDMWHGSTQRAPPIQACHRSTRRMREGLLAGAWVAPPNHVHHAELIARRRHGLRRGVLRRTIMVWGGRPAVQPAWTGHKGEVTAEQHAAALGPEQRLDMVRDERPLSGWIAGRQVHGSKVDLVSATCNLHMTEEAVPELGKLGELRDEHRPGGSDFGRTGRELSLGGPVCGKGHAGPTLKIWPAAGPRLGPSTGLILGPSQQQGCDPHAGMASLTPPSHY